MLLNNLTEYNHAVGVVDGMTLSRGDLGDGNERGASDGEG
jgi:hypothetical protein